MLELDRVCKTYGRVNAVDACTLKFSPGRTTVLIGPSGCGKSTILRLLIGLQLADSGEISFEGEPITSERLIEIRRRMGYVIQEGGLFPHLSAGRNVSLLARHIGMPPGRIDARISELCELTHLPESVLARFPGQLSGGQRQRVSLMRALMLDPEVLLLDEPLGALDPMIRYELQRDLKEIFASLDKTVVLVTHDLSEAAFFGEEVVLLRDGRIVQQGTIDEMIASPADEFVHRFIRAQSVTLEGREERA